MFILVNQTEEYLMFCVQQYGLPFVAYGLEDRIVGFIFAQYGGYDVTGMRQVGSIGEMLEIAGL